MRHLYAFSRFWTHSQCSIEFLGINSRSSAKAGGGFKQLPDSSLSSEGVGRVKVVEGCGFKPVIHHVTDSSLSSKGVGRVKVVEGCGFKPVIHHVTRYF